MKICTFFARPRSETGKLSFCYRWVFKDYVDGHAEHASAQVSTVVCPYLELNPSQSEAYCSNLMLDYYYYYYINNVRASFN